MALHGLCFSPNFENIEAWHFSGNLSNGLMGPNLACTDQKVACSVRAKSGRARCLSRRQSLSPVESEENSQKVSSFLVDDESAHVMRFKMSDFKRLDRVSIGHGGRADELVFEAVVHNPDSPLYKEGVVLRQLTSVQAQRRGRRAIEVLKKLSCRRLMYHSYSMQVHGYISSLTTNHHSLLTLVHGHHGSFSLRHWLQQADWLPTLEATLALDEESVKKVGDDTIGGPAVSRQLRVVRLLMRDLLIGVNYLHSHGLAHTELRLENVHISPVDRHIKVGILGNAADFYKHGSNGCTADSNTDRRQMMIAFDMRCVGFMMAKMVLQELMDPVIFTKIKSFLTKGNDPSCLREFFLRTVDMNSASGNPGVQILDRNWGAGWNLLSSLIATRPSDRISCLDALKHPFLCGPRWRIVPSIDIIRWGLGSTAVRISEEYIYRGPQRGRLAHFIRLMEMLNPHARPRNWLKLLPGKWRLLYCTGRHIGLTFRQPSARVLIGDVHLTISRASKVNTNLCFTSDIGFTVLMGQEWPHDKSGTMGKLQASSMFRLMAGRRLYTEEEKASGKFFSGRPNPRESSEEKSKSNRRKKVVPFEEFPSSLPVAKLVSGDIELSLSLDDPLSRDTDAAKSIVQEVRMQIPPEMFDLSKIVCGTYVDSRLLVVRGVNGSALLFTRSSLDNTERRR